MWLSSRHKIRINRYVRGDLITRLSMQVTRLSLTYYKLRTMPYKRYVEVKYKYVIVNREG